MARYVRAVSEDRRKEVILLYMEPLSRHGRTIVDFPDDGLPSEAFDEVSASLVNRAREAFTLLQ